MADQRAFVLVGAGLASAKAAQTLRPQRTIDPDRLADPEIALTDL